MARGLTCKNSISLFFLPVFSGTLLLHLWLKAIQGLLKNLPEKIGKLGFESILFTMDKFRIKISRGSGADG